MADVKTVLKVNPQSLDLDRPVMLVGMPSPGLVGTISAVHLSQRHKFKFIGYITSESFAPVAAVHDYEVLPPVRIMASEEMNFIVVISEISIPISASMKVADTIIALARKFNVREICVLSSTGDESSGIYHVATGKEISSRLKSKLRSKPLEEGALAGVGSSVLVKAEMAGIPAYSLLVTQYFEAVDPKASASLLKAISKIYGAKIDVKELEEEAKTIEKTITSQFGGDSSPSMYR